MYLNDYMKGLDPSFRDFIGSAIEIWSNDAALGYAIAAAEAAGLSDHEKAKLLYAMRAAFENMTVDEAASYYITGDY